MKEKYFSHDYTNRNSQTDHDIIWCDILSWLHKHLWPVYFCVFLLCLTSLLENIDIESGKCTPRTETDFTWNWCNSVLWISGNMRPSVNVFTFTKKIYTLTKRTESRAVHRVLIIPCTRCTVTLIDLSTEGFTAWMHAVGRSHDHLLFVFNFWKKYILFINFCFEDQSILKNHNASD